MLDWGTVPAWITAVVLAASAVGAWVTVHNARRLRLDQTRPWVIVDFDIKHSIFLDIVIKNHGATVAKDVRFTFEPPLESSQHDGSNKGKPISEWTILKKGLRTLPPGREYRFWFDRGPDRLSKSLPDEYEVTISYLGPTNRRHVNTYTLDIAPYWGMERLDLRDLDAIARELEKIRKRLDQKL